VTPDGTIIVRAKTKSILDMAGMLKALKGQTGWRRRDESLALMTRRRPRRPMKQTSNRPPIRFTATRQDTAP
jgi:hypothetical protein